MTAARAAQRNARYAGGSRVDHLFAFGARRSVWGDPGPSGLSLQETPARLDQNRGVVNIMARVRSMTQVLTRRCHVPEIGTAATTERPHLWTVPRRVMTDSGGNRWIARWVSTSLLAVEDGS